MNYKFYALIQGGIGPDVWDSEMEISAVDISDALRQAHSLAEELGGTVMEVTQSDWGSPIAGSITGLKRTLTRLNDRVHSGYDFNADPDNMTNEVCEALGGFYSIEIAELARLQSRLAECESLVVKKDEALKTCLEMFREIRGDWTDPRMECRAGADAAVAALALTPADCAGMECVPTGELAELRRDKERLDWLQCEFDNAGRRVQWGYTGKDSFTITVAAHGCDKSFSYPTVRAAFDAVSAARSAGGKQT